MKQAIYLLAEQAFDRIYGPEQRAAIEQMVDIPADPHTSESIQQRPELLADVEVIFSGWGMAKVDESLLTHAPQLEFIFYGAGSIRGFTTDAMWDRGIRVCSAWAANAVPVAEFSFANIILLLKRAWRHAIDIKAQRRYAGKLPVAGAYGSTVGIVSLGEIGRQVCRWLQQLDVNVIAYDPYVAGEHAAELGAELVDLPDLFRRSDVVSIHTPWLPETEGMIDGKLIDSMKPGAGLLNTSRGAVIDEPAMVEVLQRRDDLCAVLDVTWPEPPPPDSPLYTLPNVILTPHIAGSMDAECRRMGQTMVEECRRWLAGEPLEYEVTREQAQVMA